MCISLCVHVRVYLLRIVSPGKILRCRPKIHLPLSALLLLLAFAVSCDHTIFVVVVPLLSDRCVVDRNQHGPVALVRDLPAGRHPVVSLVWRRLHRHGQ